MLLHTDAFTHRHLYTQTPSHTDIFRAIFFLLWNFSHSTCAVACMSRQVPGSWNDTEKNSMALLSARMTRTIHGACGPNSGSEVASWKRVGWAVCQSLRNNMYQNMAGRRLGKQIQNRDSWQKGDSWGSRFCLILHEVRRLTICHDTQGSKTYASQQMLPFPCVDRTSLQNKVE